MIMAPQQGEQEKKELQRTVNLTAARDVLRTSLEKSWDIDLAIQGNSAKLDKTKKRLELLKESFKDVAGKCNLFKVGSKVDSALGPAASVLRIFLVIQELQASLQTGCSRECDDLREYLTTVQRIDDAVRLLKDNCELVMLWLQDASQFLNADDKELGPEDEWYVLTMKKVMKILEGIDQSFSFGEGGGFLTEAFGQLEDEFRRTLIDNRFLPSSLSLLTMADNPGTALIPYPSFPAADVDKMQAIMERFSAKNRLPRCASIYVEVRSSNVRAALQGLDVHYLQLTLSERDSVQSLECFIDQWRRHLQFTVKYLFEIEYRLCHQVFQDADLGMECFANIVVESGFYDFIKFGKAVTGGKKEAIKLLKLLDIFAALKTMRLDFNRLFGGKWKSCQDIQAETRELIKRVVNGACEIFWDLSVQVEAQRPTFPPLDGRVPRLVRFVTDFCNALLEEEEEDQDKKTSTLLEVLEIHCSWNNVEFDEGILPCQIRRIMRELELNLQAWSEVYEDPILSYLFRMNNYWFLCNNIKATKLGDVMGDEWLMAYEEEMQHYQGMYLGESWKKLAAILDEDGLVLFPGGRAIDEDLARKRLAEFNNAFEDMYTKQIYWVVSDKGLRLRTRHRIAQTIIPCYDNYLRKYIYMSHLNPHPHFEEARSKHVKYSSASLRDIINFLFQLKLGNKKNDDMMMDGS